jgi:hypothetical protein
MTEFPVNHSNILLALPASVERQTGTLDTGCWGYCRWCAYCPVQAGSSSIYLHRACLV